MVPGADSPGAGVVIRVDSALVRACGFDGTERAELGSDGEYLIDAWKPYRVVELATDQVFVSPSQTVEELVAARDASRFRF